MSQSSGVKIKALIDLFQPRFRILGQSEALADGVVGGEIGTSSQRDRIVEFKAVEHRDFVGVQSYALPGDEGPVQHRRRVFSPCLDRQLGESDDQGLDTGVAASKYLHAIEALARSAGPRLCHYRMLQQQVLHTIGQGVEPEVGLVEQLGSVSIGLRQLGHFTVPPVLFAPAVVYVD